MSAAPGGDLRIERSGDVLWIRIDRPEQRNALSLAVLDELGAAFRHNAADESLRAAVIIGTGERSFAAGGDLKELNELRGLSDAESIEARGRAALDAVREFPVPVLAALNGTALGGGAELALACDGRIAVASASIGFLQGKLGLTTAWGGSADLMALVGPQRALNLLLSTRVLRAEEATAAGILDVIVPAHCSLREAVVDYIGGWADKPLHVVRGYTALARKARLELRGTLSGRERDAFLQSWVHDAHWTAAARALTKPAKV